jgi:Ca2+-binding RTX toxin-like protein
MGSGAVSLASLVIHDQLAKHSMTGILTYMAFMEYAGMVLGGAEETGGSLRVAAREGGGYDVLNAYGEQVGEIVNGNMTVRDKYGASFTINKDGTTAESFPNDTSPVENTIAITTKNPGATENGATDPTDGSGVAGGTAIETGSYKVAFSNGELNSSSVYAAAVAAMTTGGIRPGNWNVMPDASIAPVPAHLISDISQTLTIPVDAGINPGSYTIDPSGLIIPSIHTSSRTYVDPLILDLNGDGVRLTNFTERTVLFDIDHDGGSLEQTGWVSAEDGILVHDLNGNGKIDGIHETLSEYYNGAAGTEGEAGEKRYSDGFAALQSLDSNHDNQFTDTDAAWDQLRVWVDADSDGITDAGELKTLTELGISAIDLNPERQSGLVNGGNEILAEGSFTQNGEQRQAQAVNFIASSAGSIFTSTENGLRTDTQDNNGQTTSSYLHMGTDDAMLDTAALNVQNLTGGNGNDTLTGDANANWLAGGRGADILNAGGGDDVLLFDSEDRIDGGDGNDIAQVIGDKGVVLNLAQSHIEAVVGGRGADILIGGGRSSVFMRGGDGDDILIGGAANDVLSG